MIAPSDAESDVSEVPPSACCCQVVGRGIVDLSVGAKILCSLLSKENNQIFIIQ